MEIPFSSHQVGEVRVDGVVAEARWPAAGSTAGAAAVPTLRPEVLCALDVRLDYDIRITIYGT